MAGLENYQSSWVTQLKSAEEFEAQFGESRQVFRDPLSACYKYLARTEMAEGDILSLGIGTGQVEQMAGIDSRRITGVDTNRLFLQLAKRRLPDANLQEGIITTLLPTLPRFPLIFASESLDCISPRELTSVLLKVREKTDKLVAVQTYTPDAEYYNYFWPDHSEGSYTGPGFESLSEGHLSKITEVLTACGIEAPITDTPNLLRQTQAFVEQRLGGPLGVDIIDVYDYLGLQYRSFKPERVAGRPYPSQITMFHSRAEMWLAQQRTPALLHSQELYVAVHTAHRLAQLFAGTLQTEFYFTILEDALAQADFTQIEQKRVIASGRKLAKPGDLIGDLNRGLEYTRSQHPPIRNSALKVKNSLFANGIPATFMEPFMNPFNDAQVRFVVAS